MILTTARAWLGVAWTGIAFLLIPFAPSSLLVRSSLGQIASVRLTPIDGESVEGKLISADSQKVRLDISGETRSWTSQEVLKVEFDRKPSPANAPLELRLLDGSKLKGQKLVGREQQWQFGDSSGTIQEFGPGVVRSLLVRSLSPELAKAWNDAIKEPSESDALVLVRPGNVVDRISGIIIEVKDGKVGFDLDGQTVEVGFEKLLGMIWFRKQPDRMKPRVEIDYTDGSSVLTETLSISGETMTYKSFSGQDVSIPLSRVALLNYANANVKWLADVPAMNAVSNRRIEWKGEPSHLGKVMAPQFVASRGTVPVGGSPAAEDLDLVFPSTGSFTFRVPDGFSRLRAIVGRSGEGNARSDLLIEVWQDDANLLRHTFGIDEETMELDVAVLGGKKVTLSVVSKSRLQVGCQLTWKQPRLTR